MTPAQTFSIQERNSGLNSSASTASYRKVGRAVLGMSSYFCKCIHFTVGANFFCYKAAYEINTHIKKHPLTGMFLEVNA